MSINITPTQTKDTLFGGTKLKQVTYDQLYDSYSKFTVGELEDLFNSKHRSGDIIVNILEKDGDYIDDGIGDVAWESLSDYTRHQLHSELKTVTLEIKVITDLINVKSK